MTRDYSSIIQSAAKQYNVDPKLISALISVESGGDVKAVSEKGAKGLGQLMPATAASLGVKDPHDPKEAIPAIARLLDENLKRYGNVNDALMAYHGGTDQANWGPKTQAYPGKILAKLNQPPADDAEAFFQKVTGGAKPTDDADAFFNSLVKQPSQEAPQAQTLAQESPSKIASAAAGAGKAMGEGVLGAQRLLGKGMQLIGMDQAGNWLVQDAEGGIKKLEAENKPYAQANPISNVAGQVGGTMLPAGLVTGAIGKGVQVAGKIPGLAGMAAPLAEAVATGGFKAGGLTGLGGLLTRAAGGALGGAGVSAVYSPDEIAKGAAIGAALPVAGQAIKQIGHGLGTLAGSGVSPQVADLALKAKAQGIDIRPDQLIRSKPIDAVSAALDYVPFSGKGASTAKQMDQFNTAISKTVGENTPDVAQALKSAETKLGSKFDAVLKNTAVKADNAFQNDLVGILNNARNEMTEAQYGVMTKQVDNILNKVKPGDVIDADAAYNIKKGLDRLGKSNDSTLAFYAKETRGALLDALNRSLPDKGAEFAKTRQQWANLMQLQKIVPAGAEGSISPARLANMRGVNTPDLGQLQDIAGQFLKGRMGDSGTAQRMAVYESLNKMGGAGALGGLAYADPTAALTAIGAGRVANSVLGSSGLASLIANRAAARGVNNSTSVMFNQMAAPITNSLYPALTPEILNATRPTMFNLVNQ